MRKPGFLVCFALALQLPSVIHAQGPVVRDSDPTWQASYWNSMMLSGLPVTHKAVKDLDFDWGYGSPHPSVSIDRFSARWRRYIDLPVGTYRFTATSDDGIRVHVDDRLIIDQWHDHPARTWSTDVDLQAGHHMVLVEYYENGGAAAARLTWTRIGDDPPPAPIGEVIVDDCD